MQSYGLQVRRQLVLVELLEQKCDWIVRFIHQPKIIWFWNDWPSPSSTVKSQRHFLSFGPSKPLSCSSASIFRSSNIWVNYYHSRSWRVRPFITRGWLPLNKPWFPGFGRFLVSVVMKKLPRNMDLLWGHADVPVELITEGQSSLKIEGFSNQCINRIQQHHQRHHLLKHIVKPC